MHHALELDEILSNIFDICNTPPNRACLAALARTCRTFKEPALDLLWSELPDLSPLARCLPEATCQPDPDLEWAFRRPLKQAEWATLLSYTHRVRSMLDLAVPFGMSDVRTLFSPPTSDPLFPNLHYLHFRLDKLVYQSSSLLKYSVRGNPSLLQDSLELFTLSSPNMRHLSIDVIYRDVIFDKAISNCICHWSNLHTACCPRTTLDMDTLLHLSCMPDLTRLEFTSTRAISPDGDAPLVFSKLQELVLSSASLVPISDMFLHIRLPVITDFSVRIVDYPSKENVMSFLTALRTSTTDYSITMLELTQDRSNPGSDTLVLAPDDLRPSMAFKNIRQIKLNLGWHVGLTDDGLLELASAWPHLEHLRINEELGWHTSGGITPDGLVRLLQTCRSLSWISLAIDTRGYTDIPPLRCPTDLGLDPPSTFAIDVVDSHINEACVPAMAVFLATIVPSVHFQFQAWRVRGIHNWEGPRIMFWRWESVCDRARTAVAWRSMGMRRQAKGDHVGYTA